MAKGTLPRIDDTPVNQEQPTIKPVAQQEVQVAETIAHSRTLRHVRRIDVLLPPKHRQIMSAKIRQLQDTSATLADGTLVTDKTKAFLWILENLVDV